MHSQIRKYRVSKFPAPSNLKQRDTRNISRSPSLQNTEIPNSQFPSSFQIFNSLESLNFEPPRLDGRTCTYDRERSDRQCTRRNGISWSLAEWRTKREEEDRVERERACCAGWPCTHPRALVTHGEGDRWRDACVAQGASRIRSRGRGLVVQLEHVLTLFLRANAPDHCQLFFRPRRGSHATIDPDPASFTNDSFYVLPRQPVDIYRHTRDRQFRESPLEGRSSELQIFARTRLKKSLEKEKLFLSQNCNIFSVISKV